MGVFAEWQPAYDEAGIVTFPVDAVAKRPRVEHYNKIGRRGSAQLAVEFERALPEFPGGFRKRAGLFTAGTPTGVPEAKRVLEVEP